MNVLQSALLVAAFTAAVLYFSVLSRSLYPTVRGPKSSLLIGSLYEFLTWGPLKTMTTYWKEYGDVFKIRIGLKETLVVADPELIREVAVKKFKLFRNRPGPYEAPKFFQFGIVLGRDKYWSIARGSVLPWFHNKDHLGSYMGLMKLHVDQLVEELDALEPADVIDIYERLQALALNVFCTAAFGATLKDSTNSEVSQVVRLVAQATRDLSVPSASSVLGFFLPETLAKVVNRILAYTPYTREHTRRRQFLERQRISQRLLELRQKEIEAGSTAEDVLAQLIRAQAKTETQEDVQLGPKQLMYIVNELILAGSDTTSNTIAFAVFLLATHPEAETKMVQEIHSLAADFPPTSLDDLGKYKYVANVVRETLRLYPIGSQLVREAEEDTTVGTIRVPRGGRLMFPLWLLHRNPKHFHHADEFLPERFDPASPESEGNNMDAYMPFGSGPRMCLGSKFALQEAVLALVCMFHKRRFALAGSMQGVQGNEAISRFPVESGVIMKPRDGVKVHVLKA